MSKIKNTVYFNQSYFDEQLKEKNLTMVEICRSIGVSESYVKNARAKKSIRYTMAKLICMEYGMDINMLTEEPKEELFNAEIRVVDNSEMLSKIDEINLRLRDIQTRFSELETRLEDAEIKITFNGELSSVEYAVMLLNSMMRYGACEEKLYRQKGSSEGLSKESMTEAIKQQRCTRKMINGKCWLEK